jgi:hypothetical protein
MNSSMCSAVRRLQPPPRRKQEERDVRGAGKGEGVLCPAFLGISAVSPHPPPHYSAAALLFHFAPSWPGQSPAWSGFSKVRPQPGMEACKTLATLVAAAQKDSDLSDLSVIQRV